MIIKRKTLFQKIQKFNFRISKLRHLINIKYKKSKNNKNLYGEDFKPHHIKLIEDGVKYNFDFFEMYNIINSCFKQLREGVPVIFNIKNPYTNKNFSYFNIINIYFLLMKSGRIPKYFYIYFNNNLSKNEIYNNYHFSLFIDIMKYKYSHFTTDVKIKYIDKMLDYFNYDSFLRKSNSFKIEYFSGIAVLFFISIKILVQYGDNYYDDYCRYVNDCRTKLKSLRMNHNLFNNYTIKLY